MAKHNQPVDAAPLAAFGVVRDGAWRVVFYGGVNAVTLRFAEEPEHRAIETLMSRFDATTAQMTPPELARADADADPAGEMVDALANHPEVQAAGATGPQIAAVLDALGGINEVREPQAPLDAERGTPIEVRAPDYSGDGVDSDGDYCWVPAEVVAVTPSGDVVADVGGEYLSLVRADVREPRS